MINFLAQKMSSRLGTSGHPSHDEICKRRLDEVGLLIMVTRINFTQLCSKFPPTAFLNFACDG